MSPVRKDGYQKTVVGWIPSHWRFLPIGAIAQESALRNGSNTDLPVILCSKHVGFVRSLDYFKKKIFSDDTSNYKVVKRNWIAYPSNHIEEGSIGLQNICDEGIVSPIYTVFSLNGEVEPDFIHRLLKTELYRRQYVAAMNGSVDRRGSLRWTQFSQIRVPVPPLSEQQKIAAILTAVDDKLDLIARQIEATQTLKRGLMQTLFSRGVGTQDADGRWVPHAEFKDSELGKIPVSWSERKASEICDVRDGTHDSPKFHEHGIPFYTSKNISNGKLTSKGAKLISLEDAEKFNKRSQVHRGDILMSMIGTVGEAALVDVEPDFCIKNVGMFKPNNSMVSPRYLLYFFQSPAFKTFVKTQLDGGIQKFLSLTALRTLKIPLPPLEEQNEIANFLDAVTWKFELLEARRTHFITLKHGLMQKLLTGEWRVNLDAEAIAA